MKLLSPCLYYKPASAGLIIVSADYFDILGSRPIRRIGETKGKMLPLEPGTLYHQVSTTIEKGHKLSRVTLL